MKSWFCGLLCFVALFGAVAVSRQPAVADPARSDLQHIRGTLVMPDGGPAAGVAVMLYTESFTSLATSSIAGSSTADARGAFDIAVDSSAVRREYPILWAHSDAGVAVLSPQPFDKQWRIVLESFTTVRLHCIDENGKPVAHTRVFPCDFLLGSQIGGWDDTIDSRWTQTTDDAGTVTFSGLPQGCSVLFMTAGDAYLGPEWNAGNTVVLAKSAQSADQTVRFTHGGSVSGTVTDSATHLPVSGVMVEPRPIQGEETGAHAVTDAQGRYRVARLAAGPYTVETFEMGDADNRVSKPAPAGVLAEQEVKNVDLSLVPCGIVRGIITDNITHKPVSQIMVAESDDAHPHAAFSLTGPDGRFRFNVLPGSVRIAPQVHVGPFGAIEQQLVQVAADETKTVEFKIDAPVTLAVTGTVLGPDGKPIAGADVIASVPGQPDSTATTDSRGRFVFDHPGLSAKSRLRARKGTLGTDRSVLAASSKSPTLRLSCSALITLEGRVQGADRHPVAGISVILFQSELNSHEGMGVATVKTDSEGRYRFYNRFADETYSVNATAAGYTESGIQVGTCHAVGGYLNFAPLVIDVADSFVGGTVVNSRGRPIVAARVEATAIDGATTITDSKGSFRLDGVTRNAVLLRICAPDVVLRSTSEASGRLDDVVTTESQEEQAAADERFNAKFAADSTKHGNGENAMILLKAAEARAAAGHKAVFLDFHSSWCGGCYVLHRFLNDPHVKPIIDAQFVVQEIDIWEGDRSAGNAAWENPGGTTLYKRYGGPDSVPYFVLLDSSGKVLAKSMYQGQNMGCPEGADSIQYFLAMLKRVAPSLTKQDLSAIRDGLTRNAYPS